MYLRWSWCTFYLHACHVSYHRQRRSLLYLWYVFWALINSVVCWFIDLQFSFSSLGKCWCTTGDVSIPWQQYCRLDKCSGFINLFVVFHCCFSCSPFVCAEGGRGALMVKCFRVTKPSSSSMELIYYVKLDSSSLKNCISLYVQDCRHYIWTELAHKLPTTFSLTLLALLWPS